MTDPSTTNHNSTPLSESANDTPPGWDPTYDGDAWAAAQIDYQARLAAPTADADPPSGTTISNTNSSESAGTTIPDKNFAKSESEDEDSKKLCSGSLYRQDLVGEVKKGLQGAVLPAFSQVRIVRWMLVVFESIGPVVHTEWRFLRYLDDLGTWVHMRDDEMGKAVLELDGAETSKNRDKPKSFNLSAAKAVALDKLLVRQTRDDSWRSKRAPGLVLRANGEKRAFRVVLGPDGPEKKELTPDCAVLETEVVSYPMSEADGAPPTPQFDAYLATLFAHLEPDEKDDVIRYLEEVIGSLLFRTATRYKTHLLLVGKADAGKSVLLEIIESMFPSGTAVPLGNLSGEFSKTQLLDSPVNVVNELELGSLRDTATQKAVLSGDPVEVNRKYKDPITVAMDVGHSFGANGLPHTRDAALIRRLPPILCPNSVPEEKQIPDLAKIIVRNELAGLLHRFIAGADRLHQRGHHKIPASVERMKKIWTNSVAIWAEERTTPGPWTKMDPLFDDYAAWCSAHCVDPRPPKTWSENLGAWGAKSQNRGPKGGRGWCLSLRDDR